MDDPTPTRDSDRPGSGPPEPGEAMPDRDAGGGGGGRKRRRSARRPLIILGVLVGAGLLALGIYLFLTRNQQSTDDAQVAADLVEIAPQVSGRIRRIAVIENQQVKAGDLLVEIDEADYAARLRQAAADVRVARAQADAADAQVQIVEASSRGGLKSARAQLSETGQDVASAQAQVAAARAVLARAEAEAVRTEADFRRAVALRRQSVIAQAVLDQSRAANDAAQAAVVQSRAQLKAAEDARRAATSRVVAASGRLKQSQPIEAQIEAAEANADLAHARVDAALAGQDLARLQLSYTRLVAPRAGYASKLTARVGQLVEIGEPLIQLVPLESYVVANFKETQIGRMRPGQRASVKIDTYGNREIEGRVESLSGGTGAVFALLPPDNASGNFVKVVQRVPVRIAWVNPPTDLVTRAGLSAYVTVYFK